MTDEELQQRLRAHYRTIDPGLAPPGVSKRIVDSLERPSRPQMRIASFPASAAVVAVVMLAAVGLAFGLRSGGLRGVAEGSLTPAASAQPGSSSPNLSPSQGAGTSPVATILATPGESPTPSAAPASRRPAGSLLAAALVTANDGWALSGDELLVTGDGGRSWHVSGYPGQRGDRLFGATFSDPNHGWIVREKVPADASQTPLQVIIDRTDDAGATWEPVSLPPIRGSTHEAIIASPTFSMVNAQVGYLLLATDPTPSVLLYFTIDGGRTWSLRPTPPGRGWITFLDASRGWTAGGATDSTLFTTADGALTWASQRLPAQPGIAPSDLVLTSGLSRTSTGQLVLFAPFARDGDGGAFFRSGDDGTTWSFGARAPQPGGTAAAVLGDRDWLVASSSTLLFTHDAGATWVSRNVGLPGPLRRLDVADPAHLSAVVEKTGCGAAADCFVPFGLYLSSDGGINWRDATP